MEPTTNRAAWDQAYARVESALREANTSQCADLLKLEEVRVRFLGRKSELTELLKSLKDLSIDDKKEAGPKVQALKSAFEQIFAAPLLFRGIVHQEDTGTADPRLVGSMSPSIVERCRSVAAARGQ